MSQIVDFTSTYIDFSQPIRPHEFRLTNRFGVQIPDLVFKGTRVQYNQLAQGSYFIEWTFEGEFYTVVQEVFSEDLISA